MSKCDKLLKKAQQSPNNLRFEELCQLAVCYGFVFDRQKGSHHIYEHPKLRDLMDFQPKDGRAKPYQINQLLEAIQDLGAL